MLAARATGSLGGGGLGREDGRALSLARYGQDQEERRSRGSFLSSRFVRGPALLAMCERESVWVCAGLGCVGFWMQCAACSAACSSTGMETKRQTGPGPGRLFGRKAGASGQWRCETLSRQQPAAKPRPKTVAGPGPLTARLKPCCRQLSTTGTRSLSLIGPLVQSPRPLGSLAPHSPTTKDRAGRPRGRRRTPEHLTPQARWVGSSLRAAGCLLPILHTMYPPPLPLCLRPRL